MYGIRKIGTRFGKNSVGLKLIIRRQFSKVPNNYWNSLSNQKKFFDDLYRKLELKCMEDWYSVTLNQIKENGGSTIIKQYGSLFNALKAVYSDKKWDFCKLNTLPKNFWADPLNHKLFVEHLLQKLNLNDVTKLIEIPLTQLIELGGGKLLQKYQNNLIYALKQLYPEEDWEIQSKTKQPQSYWNNIDHQKQFFHSLYCKLKLNSLDDWYNISTGKIISEGGSFITYKYRTLYECLQTIYPDHYWDINKFLSSKKDPKYWDDSVNQRSFIEEVYRTKNFTSHEDWKQITKSELIKLGGHSLLKRYSGNLYLVMSSLYPHLQWNFLDSSKLLRSQTERTKEILEKIIRLYKIERKEDWYRVSLRTAGKESHSPYGGDQFIKMLKQAYPTQTWGRRFSMRNKKSEQRLIYSGLSAFYPTLWLIEDYKTQKMIYQDSDFPIEIDIFIPAYNIAIEYQGHQHYDDVPKAFSPNELYKRRDTEKISILSSKGIDIMSIPYWFSPANNLEQLKGEIDKQICKHVYSQ